MGPALKYNASSLLARPTSTGSSVLLVAHNPDIASFAERLCGDGDDEALRALHAKYPTGGFAVIRLDCADWSKLRYGNGYLESFVVPRSLPDA